MFRVIFFIFMINQSVQTADLLFKSSFEKGVYLSSPDRKDSPIWWQELKGSDNGTFSWPINLHGKDGLFQIITNNDNISSYIENSLINTIGIDKKPSRVLQLSIKRKENGWSQDPYVVYTGDKEQKKIYLRYSLKFPSDLAERLGKDGWLTFCEYKTASDYRLAFYIYCDKNKKLYWYVHGDNVVLDDRPYKEFWFQENLTAVNAGEWMDMEIYWNRSEKNDGQVWMAVDGKVIFDYKGKTKLQEPIHMMMLFTNYAKVPMTQWVDNIQIWSDFPCGENKSCHKKSQSEKEKNEKI
jgi:hypothetical protein